MGAALFLLGAPAAHGPPGGIFVPSEAAEWPLGYGRRVLARVDSTLDEARRMTPGLTGPEWILAHEQTAARGRRGRAWKMPVGNFAATLILRPTEPVAQAALRSFVAALALHDALASAVGESAGLALKWPNDCLLYTSPSPRDS